MVIKTRPAKGKDSIVTFLYKFESGGYEKFAEENDLSDNYTIERDERYRNTAGTNSIKFIFFEKGSTQIELKVSIQQNGLIGMGGLGDDDDDDDDETIMFEVPKIIFESSCEDPEFIKKLLVFLEE
ncbi:MAG: hypothetical protein WCG55_01745 [bacterium]